MLRPKLCSVALAVPVFLLIPATGFAQLGGPEASLVSGNGTVFVKQRPTLVRMSIQLQGQGKSMKEALAKLDDRKTAAIKQLQAIGAKKDAIHAGEPGLAAEEPDQQRQMQRMMMQQMRSRGGRPPKTSPVAESASVSLTLTAEWPLTMKGNDELLLFAKDLQDKVKAADLAGLKEPKKLSAEDEELQEEMAEAMNQYGGYNDNQPKPGEPAFLFVARISDHDRNAAMASAFTKAKDDAQRLAAAAGSELGRLSSLTGTVGSAGPGRGYNQYYARGMGGGMVPDDDEGEDDKENEAALPQPTMIRFQIAVHASFHLK